eukprot:5083987-Alexandrium_andersonii.AAC.1
MARINPGSWDATRARNSFQVVDLPTSEDEGRARRRTREAIVDAFANVDYLGKNAPRPEDEARRRRG